MRQGVILYKTARQPTPVPEFNDDDDDNLGMAQYSHCATGFAH